MKNFYSTAATAAMELAGLDPLSASQVTLYGNQGVDPYAYVISANLHRRHLTAEQRREIIAKLLKAKPESSNLQVAKQVKADDKTVAKVRRELEGRSEIPNVESRTDIQGRQQPAKKPKSLLPKGAATKAPPVRKSPSAAQLQEQATDRLAGAICDFAGRVDEQRIEDAEAVAARVAPEAVEHILRFMNMVKEAQERRAAKQNEMPPIPTEFLAQH
jgi:hypothetical protein